MNIKQLINELNHQIGHCRMLYYLKVLNKSPSSIVSKCFNSRLNFFFSSQKVVVEIAGIWKLNDTDILHPMPRVKTKCGMYVLKNKD